MVQKPLGAGVADAERWFDTVVDEYGKLLRQAIVRSCPKDLGIQFDDIEQEARLRLWRALQSERPITDLASYIYKIAVTTTIDAVRRVKARHEEQLHVVAEREGEAGSPMADPNDSPERLVERGEVMRRVEEALASLSENRRRAVGLHLQGLSNQEIATVLGWSEPKARNLIYRGLKELRERLRAAEIECEID